MRAAYMLLSAVLFWAATDLVPGKYQPTAKADWTRVEVGGKEYCKDSRTGTLFPAQPYTSKKQASQATVGCNVITTFVPWLGTAEAQAVLNSMFPAHFPTDINVGSGPPPAKALSPPWAHQDVGSPLVAGDCFDQGGVITISGQGDFHKDTAAFHACYLDKTGDWRIDFPFQTLTGAGSYKSCGVAIADSFSSISSSKYTYLTVFQDNNQVVFGGRPDPVSNAYETTSSSSPGSFTSTGTLRIEKLGSVQTGYFSTDGGMTFTQVGSTTWTPAGTFKLFVYVDSGEAATLATCTGLMPVVTSLSSSSAGNVNFVAGPTGTAAADSIAESAGPDGNICVARSVDTSGAVSVQIQNAGTGSAVAGTDFTNIFPVTLSWANGVGGTQCTSLPITNRAGSQPTRTINLTLGAATGGVTIGSTQTTHVTTITDNNLVAIKTANGFYGGNLSSDGCMPNFGCGLKSFMLNQIATEICPNQYITGYALMAAWSLLEDDILGHFSDDPNRGFPLVDALRDALAACGKKLDITMLDYAPSLDPSFPSSHFPKYLFQQHVPDPFANTTWTTDGTCGDDPSCPYGLEIDGITGTWWLRVWQNGIRDRKLALMNAYCARYDNDPTLVQFSVQYDDNQPYVAWQIPALDNAIYINHQARLGNCQHMGIRLGMTFSSSWTQLDNAMAANLADKTELRGTDIYPKSVAPDKCGTPCAAYWQALVMGGHVDGGGNLVPGGGTDYRGVTRWSEEFESTEGCHRWFGTPDQFYTYFTNPDDGWPAHYPNKVIVQIDTGCPPGYGWNDWKAKIQAVQGKLFNGHDGTPRTPHELNTTWCETGIGQCLEQ